MPKFFVANNQINNKKIYIVGVDVNHIKNVLRKKIGDEIEICNKDEEETYLCEIKNIKEEQIQCEIKNKIKKQPEPKTKITIFQGLPKADKMELIIQKSVELGVSEITPVKMKRCIVKINEKEQDKKIQRWQKQSESAAKQCGRNNIPLINNIITIKEIAKQINNFDYYIIANENEKKITIKSVLKKIKDEKNNEEIKIGILIGPEGGLEPIEVKELEESGAISITLGERILRTETVALNIISIIMYELEN